MASRRVTLNPREAALAHEAIWMLYRSDDAWHTDEVRALEDKLDRYAEPARPDPTYTREDPDA